MDRGSHVCISECYILMCEVSVCGGLMALLYEGRELNPAYFFAFHHDALVQGCRTHLLEGPDLA